MSRFEPTTWQSWDKTGSKHYLFVNCFQFQFNIRLNLSRFCSIHLLWIIIYPRLHCFQKLLFINLNLPTTAVILRLVSIVDAFNYHAYYFSICHASLCSCWPQQAVTSLLWSNKEQKKNIFNYFKGYTKSCICEDRIIYIEQLCKILSSTFSNFFLTQAKNFPFRFHNFF